MTMNLHWPRIADRDIMEVWWAECECDNFRTDAIFTRPQAVELCDRHVVGLILAATASHANSR